MTEWFDKKTDQDMDNKTMTRVEVSVTKNIVKEYREEHTLSADYVDVGSGIPADLQPNDILTAD